MGELITSVDIGTSKVCVIIAEIDKSKQIRIIGVGISPCYGVKKGIVVDIEDTSKAVSYALEQAENMADIEVDNAYVNIAGGYTKFTKNKGVIAVSNENREINSDDVKRVLNSATIISIPQNQQIIDIIPLQYIIDGYDEIRDPIGMTGIRLEADVDIVTASATTVLNIVKSVNGAGLEVLGIVAEPLATSESVLTEDEKELGVLLIDIGAGTTDVSLFKNGSLIYNFLVPIAGNHITNDISIGFRIPYKESEDIKRKYGLNFNPNVNKKRIIEVTPIGSDERINITNAELSEIIEARVNEIIEIIYKELFKRGFVKDILAGIVLTGGGIGYFPKGVDLTKKMFELPARIGKPDYIGIQEPIYSTAAGLINYSLKRKFSYYVEYNNVHNKKTSSKANSNKGLLSFLKKVWEEYF